MSRLWRAARLAAALLLASTQALAGGPADTLLLGVGYGSSAFAGAVTVQGKTVGGTYAATLGSAPVNGDWLIAFGYQGHGAGAGPPGVTAGWTSFNTVSCSGAGGPADATLAYKHAGAGESTTQTPFTLTGSTVYGADYGMAVIEVSSAETTWAALLQTSNFNCPPNTGNVSTTNTATTSSVNSLGVGFSGWYGSAGTFPIVFDGLWSILASSSNPGTGANSQILGTQRYLYSSTAVTLTSHLSPDQPFYGMASALVLLNP